MQRKKRNIRIVLLVLLVLIFVGTIMLSVLHNNERKSRNSSIITPIAFAPMTQTENIVI